MTLATWVLWGVALDLSLAFAFVGVLRVIT